MFDVFDWLLASPQAVQISAIALCLSSLTALVAIVALATSIRSLRVALRQEKRRRPNLIFDYQASSWSRVNQKMEFRIVLASQNVSDSANSLRKAELEINYRVKGHPLSVRLLCESGPESMKLPVSVPAGSSIAGVLLFVAASDWLENRRADNFALHLFDTFDSPTLIPIGMIQQSRDES